MKEMIIVLNTVNAITVVPTMQLVSRWIRLSLFAAIFSTAGVWAQPYPSKTVRVVIGYSAGAGNDVIARMVLAELSKTMGQQFVVDNRPGAAGSIAAEIVARSPNDGYTLLNAPGSIASGFSLLPKLPYNLLTDFDPVSIMASVPFLLVVHPSMPVHTVKELIAVAKARPGQLTFGSAGTGGGPHLTGELFAMRAGLKLEHIAYKGTSQANADLAGGQIFMIFSPSSSVMTLAKAKRVRAIAVTSPQRQSALPEVPTMIESGMPDFESRNWIALLAPRGMAESSVNRLNAEINRIVDTPEMKARFADIGAEAMIGTPAHWAAYLREDVAKWARVIKAAGVRVE